MGHLKKTGTNWKYVRFDVINDVNIVRRSCCLHSFATFREDEMFFSRNTDFPHNFLKVIFIGKILPPKITVRINVYAEYTNNAFR